TRSCIAEESLSGNLLSSSCKSCWSIADASCMAAPGAAPDGGAALDAITGGSACDPDTGGMASSHPVAAMREEALRVAERAQSPAEHCAHARAPQSQPGERVEIGEPLTLAQRLECGGSSRLGIDERR